MMDGDQLAQLRHFLSQGGALHMLRDTPRQSLDQLYGYACQLLQRREYHGARNLLQLLVCQDHWNTDYLLSLGVACQQLQAHDDAIVYFAQAALILVSDPRPLWLTAQSTLAQQQWALSQQALEGALALANDGAGWKQLCTLAKQQLIFCLEQQGDSDES
ncbi:tetratricopeptide repeat protein [Serratia quinivorans]|uniref:tetratricopeptide repeat protein n=1 Tax=Serratia quinivorans TaxID=137545 RepID=UPI00217C0DDF|nr:tetratricopeptide repeat protein [Serratia quinivorans]CAI1010717.1 Salmonella invasin chaperone [Serratia quinivorans]CAI1811104.1 Salmonella invasin chaperone [Serratia quinivorans]